MKASARDRLVSGAEPVVRCPRCDDVCGAKFIPAKPVGEGNLLSYTEDAEGARWAHAFTFRVPL